MLPILKMKIWFTPDVCIWSIWKFIKIKDWSPDLMLPLVDSSRHNQTAAHWHCSAKKIGVNKKGKFHILQSCSAMMLAWILYLGSNFLNPARTTWIIKDGIRKAWAKVPILDILWYWISWGVVVQSVTYRYQEFPVPGIFHLFGGIGTGIRTNWYRKKVSEQVSKIFGTGKKYRYRNYRLTFWLPSHTVVVSYTKYQ